MASERVQSRFEIQGERKSLSRSCKPRSFCTFQKELCPACVSGGKGFAARSARTVISIALAKYTLSMMPGFGCHLVP